MLNDEICKLREELNNSILNGQDYSITYKISIELDELIAEYYKIELERKELERRKRIEKAKEKKKVICYAKDKK